MTLSESRPGRLDVLKQMLRAVSYSRPGEVKQSVRRVTTQFARCAYHLEAFRDTFGDPANLALQETLALRPSLMACVIHPYLNVDWRFDQNVDAISRLFKPFRGPLCILVFPPLPSMLLGDLRRVAHD